MSYFQNKSVLVTGCCGTVGRELVRQLLEEYSVGEFIGIDNNESELFFMEQTCRKYPEAGFFLADVRDRTSCTENSRAWISCFILQHSNM
jgi:FlaA1/EpsC-like NDP-sugar epimerase